MGGDSGEHTVLHFHQDTTRYGIIIFGSGTDLVLLKVSIGIERETKIMDWSADMFIVNNNQCLRQT